MTETTTFRFERVERDCPANQNRRANGDTLHIIYDFEVWIDGEHRQRSRRPTPARATNCTMPMAVRS